MKSSHSWQLLDFQVFLVTNKNTICYLLFACVLSLQDSFQEHYIQTGRYPGPIVSVPRRLWPLITCACWSVLVLIPLCTFLVSLLSTGSTLTILVSLAFCYGGQCPPFKLHARVIICNAPPLYYFVFCLTILQPADFTTQM